MKAYDLLPEGRRGVTPQVAAERLQALLGVPVHPRERSGRGR